MADLEKTKKEGKADVFDAKAYLEKNAKAETVIKFDERLEVEIIKANGFYLAGQIVEPHITFAKELISQGFAKKVKKEED